MTPRPRSILVDQKASAPGASIEGSGSEAGAGVREFTEGAAVFDEPGIRKWIDENTDPILRLFGLPHWRVVVDYVPLRGGDGSGDIAVLMEVHAQAEYERATIRVDVSNCYRLLSTYEDLASHFEHEVLHIAVSPLTLARNTANFLLDTARDQDVLHGSWLNHEEMVIRNLERLVWGLRNAQAPR